MCNYQTTLQRPKQVIIKAQLFSMQESTKVPTHSSNQHESSPSPSQHPDYFEVYSMNGVVAQEFEEFGVVSRHRSKRQSNERNNRVRKTRVSTEIHPDLLMAELLLAGETEE
mmetsp:Transcript_15668/g.32952  ORF Transcript_15668/g.32952 Transcript_15668/m.32952 type:complete len:112 (+) Transcript_15668:85-420(+)